MKRSAPLDVRIKRIYEKPAGSDGTRVLVDRLWPRGVSKEGAAIAQWFREIAPSTELRRWFNHDVARWNAFRQRYAAELDAKDAPLEELRGLARAGRLTLVFAARDEQHNDAVVLRDVLLGTMPPGQRDKN